MTTSSDLTTTFAAPEAILFSADVERTADFYKSLGFVETFRPRTKAQPST